MLVTNVCRFPVSSSLVTPNRPGPFGISLPFIA